MDLQPLFISGWKQLSAYSANLRQSLFIRAAKLIHDEIPNSAFIIVGSGEEEEDVKAFAQKWFETCNNRLDR